MIDELLINNYNLMTVYNETGKFVKRIYLSSRLVKYNKNILPEQQ